VPITLAKSSLSNSRKKIALRIIVQIGAVALMGDTTATGPEANAINIKRTAAVSNVPENRIGQKARRSQTNFSWQTGDT